MELMHIAQHGVGVPDWVFAVHRIAIGTFFAISGFHKLFNAERHATLRATLVKCRIPCIPFMEWWVPGWEFAAGVAVAVGFFAPFFAIPLIVICLVALCTDGIERVMQWQPINAADAVDDVLYLQETFYILSLLLVIFAGPGPWRVV